MVPGFDIVEQRPVPVQHRHLLHLVLGAVLGGNMLPLGAIIHHLVNVTGRRGSRIRRHRHGADTVAPQVLGAGIRGQQAAVGAHRHLRQAGAAVEGLVLQITMDLPHHLLPQLRRAVAHTVGQLIVGLIARPYRSAVVGAEAHEITVPVVIRSTGFAGDGHAGEICLRTGTAGDNALQYIPQQIGGSLLHGAVGGGLVLHDDIPLGVLHPQPCPGLGVYAVVGDGGIGRSHLLRGDTHVVAAQAHVTGLLTVPLGQGGEAQLLHHIIIGGRRAVALIDPHGAGIQRLHQRRPHGGQAVEAGVGVLGPCAVATQIPDGIVVDSGGSGDGTVVQRRGIVGDGLGSRTALPGLRGPVPATVHRLGAQTAHHSHHVAGGIVHQRDSRLQGLAVVVSILHQIAVFKNALRNGLELAVLQRIDLIAAAVNLADGLLLCRTDVAVLVGCIVLQPQLLHQRRRHIGDDLIRIIGVVGGGLHGGLLRGLLILRRLGEIAEIRIPVAELDLLRHGGIVGGLIDLLLTEHLAQDGQLPLPVVLTGPVAEQRIIHGGIVGDADETGTLRQRQVLHILVEVHPGSRLHAVALLSQIDGVEIHLQDLGLGVILLQRQRPIDLRDLPLHRPLIVAGDVFQQLLGDGGAALCAAAGQGTGNGPQGPLPVHPVVGLEALVLDGDGGLLQILGDVPDIHPDAVFIAEQRLIHLPCLAVRPQTVQLRGYLPVIFGHIHLYVALQGLIDVGHEDPHKNGHGQHAHQHDGADDAPDPLGPSLPSVFPLMGALLCLITVVGVFFHGQRTSLSVSLFRPPTGGLRLFIRLLPAALLRKVPAAAKSTY